MNVRENVLDVLLEAEKTGRYGGRLIKGVLDKYNYEDGREKAFFKRLAEGVLERRITLDWVLDFHSKTPVEKMKPLIRNLLRLSPYQILYMEAIPDAAACNEAVRLAKKRGFVTLSGFVNGVLRSVSRNKQSLAYPDPQQDLPQYLSVYYSVPEWIVRLWIGQYGQEQAKQLLAGSGQQRHVTIRLKGTMAGDRREALCKAFADRRVLAKPHPLYKDAYELENCGDIGALPGFADGLFYVQDVSSMLAVEAAGIAPGMKVLDLCSAPGGKAMLAYEKLGLPCATDKAAAVGPVCESCLWAGDISSAKTGKIQENARRMGYGKMEISVWDAGVYQKELDSWADVVLADVPCSGLGVLGRRKDLRYRVQPEDLPKLVELQRAILEASWRYVKPGGVLLYSTCTVNRQENEENVRYVTENFPFVTEGMDAYLPEILCNGQSKSGMLQLYTGEYGTDGFFMARLRRTG